MLGVFAEFETNLRKERQLEGIAKAKAEGKYKGRTPTARAKADEVKYFPWSLMGNSLKTMNLWKIKKDVSY